MASVVKLMAIKMARQDGCIRLQDNWRQYRVPAIWAIEALHDMTDAERALILNLPKPPETET